MFKSQYILGSTVIKKTRSQFLCYDCTASNETHGQKSSNKLTWFATKWLFWDRKLKGILLLITQSIKHNVMRSQHVLLEHAHMSGNFLFIMVVFKFFFFFCTHKAHYLSDLTGNMNGLRTKFSNYCTHLHNNFITMLHRVPTYLSKKNSTMTSHK